MKLKSFDGGKAVIAQHLFEDNLVQVFDKRTGNYLRTVQVGSNLTEEEAEQIITNAVEHPKDDPNQLTLF